MRFLFFVFLFLHALGAKPQTIANGTVSHGALVRGDSTKKELALIFTADEWAEGLPFIRKTLQAEGIKAGFFFTGRGYRNPNFKKEIQQLARDGHYFGPHSDQHLLYCDWTVRDSLLVSRDSFEHDIRKNLQTIQSAGLPVHASPLFVPPYEWWNDSIAAWSSANRLQLLSFTQGIRTAADYTFPEMGAAYRSTAWLVQWLKASVETEPDRWNGAVILIHAGTDPRRKDKLYHRLPEIIRFLQKRGFRFQRIDALFQKKQ